jgi:hypothetical protein
MQVRTTTCRKIVINIRDKNICLTTIFKKKKLNLFHYNPLIRFWTKYASDNVSQIILNIYTKMETG